MYVGPGQFIGNVFDSDVPGSNPAAVDIIFSVHTYTVFKYKGQK